MIFADLPAWLDWAVPEIEAGYRLGLVHGTGPGALFGPKPDAWTDDLWDAYRAQKATTICLVVRVAQPWRTVARVRRPSIVRLEGAGLATAWAVGSIGGKSVLLTAAHAVRDELGRPTAGFAQRVVAIEHGTRDPRPFSIVRISDTSDLAVITDPFGLQPIPLAEQDAQKGDWLVAIGCAGGEPGRPVPFMHGTLSAGTVNAVKQPLMADAARVQEGDSGGPVLNMGGQVVGLVSNVKPGDAMTYVVPLSVISGFCDANGVER